MPIINIDEKGNITEEDFVITPEMIASWRAHRQLEAEFLQAEPRKRWAIIRNVYKIQMPLIMEKAAKGYLGHINPYYVAWGKIFTPIDTMLGVQSAVKALVYIRNSRHSITSLTLLTPT